MWTKELLNKLYDEVMPLFKEDIFALNDYMAKNPELGGSEFESSKRIVALLRKHGISVEYPFAGFDTAFRASINPGKTKKVALLAEYDALPTIGHACGHCASGMSTVMAALSLNRVCNDIDVQFDIIGTPDEEVHGTKCNMASDHVFDNYDFVAMVHMGGVNTVEVDFIALDARIIEFKGAPAHAAQCPEAGRNALNAARLFFDAVDMMRQHVIQSARLHGYIKNGGVASNIVPDYTMIEFISRAPKRTDLADITLWVEDIARAAAMATRTDVTISKFGEPFHELHISDLEKEVMLACYDALDMEVCSDTGTFVGSSDIGNVDYFCPAFHPIVSIGKPLLCHTKEFGEAMVDPSTHTAIENGAKYLIQLVFRLYGDPKLLSALRTEHKAYRGY